jgi:tetratricopeptide (TPR) repeat protein
MIQIMIQQTSVRILSLTCLLAAPVFCQTADTAATHYRDVKTARLTSNERIAAYEKLLQQSPADPKIQAGLAEAFIQKLRETTDFAYLNRASAMVDKMLAADPKSYDAIRLRIEIETHLHNFPKAAELAQELTERNPSDTGSLGMLGDSLMEEGQYDAAAKAYRRMLELSPNLTSYNRVAYHDFVTGDSGHGLSWMNLAVQSGSAVPENLAWCLVEFGDMLFKSGYTQQAHTVYDRALETLPGYHRAYAALGRFYAATGEYQRAADNFKKAQDVIPLPDYAAALETLDRKLGKTADAAKQRQLLDVIDKLGAVNGEKGNRMLAVVFADENRNLDRALQLAQGELATRKDVYTYDALSWVLYRAGRQKEAEEASAKAMAENTPEPMFYYHAGVIAMEGGRSEEGKGMLQKALAFNPNFAFPQADDARQRLAGDLATVGASATNLRNVIH